MGRKPDARRPGDRRDGRSGDGRREWQPDPVRRVRERDRDGAGPLTLRPVAGVPVGVPRTPGAAAAGRAGQHRRCRDAVHCRPGPGTPHPPPSGRAGADRPGPDRAAGATAVVVAPAEPFGRDILECGSFHIDHHQPSRIRLGFGTQRDRGYASWSGVTRSSGGRRCSWLGDRSRHRPFGTPGRPGSGRPPGAPSGAGRGPGATPSRQRLHAGRDVAGDRDSVARPAPRGWVGAFPERACSGRRDVRHGRKARCRQADPRGELQRADGWGGPETRHPATADARPGAERVAARLVIGWCSAGDSLGGRPSPDGRHRRPPHPPRRGGRRSSWSGGYHPAAEHRAPTSGPSPARLAHRHTQRAHPSVLDPPHRRCRDRTWCCHCSFHRRTGRALPPRLPGTPRPRPAPPAGSPSWARGHSGDERPHAGSAGVADHRGGTLPHHRGAQLARRRHPTGARPGPLARPRDGATATPRRGGRPRRDPPLGRGLHCHRPGRHNHRPAHDCHRPGHHGHRPGDHGGSGPHGFPT